MRRLRRRIASAGRGFRLAWLAPLGLAIALTGCATSSAEPTPASQALAQADRARMEDDGLPMQVAPAAGIRQLPDDPREPFSRNYGPQSPARQPSLPTRLSDAEADMVMAQAIAAHEMRRP